MRQMSFRLLMFVMTSTPIGVNAQIIPDGTLPQLSIVNPIDNTQIITGGTSLTNNLFHSFSQFSIPSNGIARFQHAPAIKNLMIRVTGNAVSNIDGKLETSLINDVTNKRGEANVFLLNPNGIIFGKDASLNLGGSFIATTADSISLSDDRKFSIRRSEDTLLTVAVPIGLQFGNNPGEIKHQSSFKPGANTVGLQVPNGKTLALLGGDLNIAGGVLSIANGKIELAALDRNSRVSFDLAAKTFTYGDRVFRNIVFSNGGLVKLAGNAVTAAHITANNISISGDQTLTGVSSITSAAGSLILFDTKGSLTIAGSSSRIVSTTSQARKGADIKIKAQNLQISQDADVSTFTQGDGSGGNLVVDVTDNVSVHGNASGLFTNSRGTEKIPIAGDAGNLTVTAASLTLENGAEINSTSGLSSGKSGDMTLNITNNIVVDGFNTSSIKPTVISTATTDAGNAGKLMIKTRNLTIGGGAQVFSSTLKNGVAGAIDIQAQDVIVAGVAQSADGTFIYRNKKTAQEPFNRLASAISADAQPGSTGKGAELTIKTDRLTVRDGAVIQSATFGSGDAGNITITAKESIVLKGIAPTPQDPFPSSIIAFSGGIPNKKVFSVPEATGKGGNITIATPNLKLTDGALIALGSLNSTEKAKGAGDRLKINADVISLDRAQLNAATNAGNGGKFDITARQLLLLRNESKVITQAGGANQGGNAGNITIKSPLIIAKKTENSDINANAAKGNGGTIDITADSIVGLEVRPNITEFSDITASSDRGVQGTITLNGPNIDPDRGTVVLPATTSDPSDRLDQSCSADRSVSGQFTIGGQGGLPASPQTPNSITPISRLATVPPSIGRSASTQNSSPVTTIREAQSSQRLANGKIRFTSTSIGNATPIGLTPHCR